MRPEPSLWIDGNEVLNGWRTARYVELGLGGGWNGGTAAMCDALHRDLGGGPIVAPGVDTAPWWSSDDQESERFLGGIITAIEGLDASTTTRGLEERAYDGANLGIQRENSRALIFTATLIGVGADALDYGLRWLASQLASCQRCSWSHITLRTSCPPDAGYDDERGRFHLYRVALTGGVQQTSRDAATECRWMDVTWTLTAADPWLYSDPLYVDSTDPVPLIPQPDAEVGLDTWLGIDSTPPVKHVAFIEGTRAGETGAVVTIQAGLNRPVREVYVHTDPAMYPAPSAYPHGTMVPMGGAGLTPLPSQFTAAPEGIVIREIPEGASLTLDLARNAAILRQSDDTEVDGLYLLAAPDGAAFGWPVTTHCASDRIVVEPAGYASDDGTATVLLQTRNRQR